MSGIDANGLGAAAGGLGLLLLGMGLLTDGLTRAAGQSLHRLLGRWTRTRLRGLAAGTLITAVVQSSSAVTVAIIGFANAGLLTLPEAAWVVFGSNLGTTMTGWLVALIGLRLQVESFALPLLGLGMLLRLLRPASRLGGLGEALAGFGALFVGLDLLRQTFLELGGGFDLTGLGQWGPFAQLAGVGLGALITVLLQSSSAAMALVLTAHSQAVLSPVFAASLVIGANVGTTSTALLSTIGATSNARRVAVLHVAFNLLTGVTALLLLTPILRGIARLHELTDVAAAPAIDLVLFHTAFNVLGILLMWPISKRLVRSLEGRFLCAEEDDARPRHLDDNVLPVPELATRALLLELRRASTLGLGLARAVLDGELEESEALAARARPVRRLLVALADYATRLNRADLSTTTADALTGLLRAHQHLWTVIHLCAELLGLRAEAALERRHADEHAALSQDYVQRALAVLDAADVSRPDFDLEACRATQDAHELARRQEYRRLSHLGATGKLFSLGTSHALQELALDRRLVSRVWKLAAALHLVNNMLGEPPSGPAASPAAREGPPETAA